MSDQGTAARKSEQLDEDLARLIEVYGRPAIQFALGELPREPSFSYDSDKTDRVARAREEIRIKDERYRFVHDAVKTVVFSLPYETTVSEIMKESLIAYPTIRDYDVTTILSEELNGSWIDIYADGRVKISHM